MFFDSHCHLTDERFAEEELPAILQRAVAARVERVTTIASDVEDAHRAHELGRCFAGVFSTAGVHPHAASGAKPGHLEQLAELLAQPTVVAVGETGLDYHYDHSPRAVQRAVFEGQLQLAADRGKPVIVHCREADDDMIAIIRSLDGAVTGVLHCFAGRAALLDAGLDEGWLVSFAGLVSFKNYEGGDLVRAVPADRLMAETDSPYLAPVPQRGRRNEPAYVAQVAAALARIRGVELEQLAATCTANTLRFYGLSDDSPRLEADSPAE